MILVIDNYDSFTYNLVQHLGEPAADLPIAREIEGARNDRIAIGEVERLAPKRIALSPAPDLDGKYSIFGKIVDGFDTPDKMEKVQRGQDGRAPIEKIELIEAVINP
jgi:anthranilate/para-aminobenzoate synthase component II